MARLQHIYRLVQTNVRLISPVALTLPHAIQQRLCASSAKDARSEELGQACDESLGIEVPEEYHNLVGSLPITQIAKVQSIIETRLNSPKVTTLTDLVQYSKDLQMLVALGVSLPDIERQEGAADLVASLRYYPDIHDVVTLLRELGVEDIGGTISRCPYILAVGCQRLKERIIYLDSMKFTRSQIATIVTTCPKWLLEKIPEIDARLGATQKIFQLSNSVVRAVAAKCPRLVLWNMVKLKRFTVILGDTYEFDKKQIAQIVTRCPSVALTGNINLARRLDIILHAMNISQAEIADWPSVLRSRERILKERHSVLEKLSLAAYKPTEPGYISLQKLVAGKVDEFCRDVALIPVEQYYEYVKTL